MVSLLGLGNRVLRKIQHLDLSVDPFLYKDYTSQENLSFSTLSLLERLRGSVTQIHTICGSFLADLSLLEKVRPFKGNKLWSWVDFKTLT